MLREFRKFNRDFTVRLGLLSRYRFNGDFTLLEARVLLEIGAGKGATHSGLLRILRIDQGYLSRVIGKLIDLGLVEARRSAEDSRSKELGLTAPGERALQRIHEQSDEQAEHLLRYLDEADRQRFLGLLAEADRFLGRILPSGVEVHWVSAQDKMPIFAGLFREYQAELGIDLSFQNFADELDRLPGPYRSPEGGLLLAEERGTPVGCAALRPLEAGRCEMKRLYVRKPWRRSGTGEALVEEAVSRARDLGYRSLRLDTLRSWSSACALYRKLGFREIPAYYPNPLRDPVFFEKPLGFPADE